MKNNSDLFYICSPIEFIGRKQKQKRAEIVKIMGKDIIASAFFGMQMCSTANRSRKR